MTPSTNTLSTIGAILLGLAVIASVTILAIHGTISGEAATGLLSTLVGGGVVGGAAHVAVKQGSRAAQDGAASVAAARATEPSA